MGFALGWSFGSKTKTPVESDVALPPSASEFRTLDLGELALPPTAIPEGYATAGFDLDIYATFSGGGAGSKSGTHHFRWSVDCILLMPIDQGEAAVSGVASSDRVLLDTLSEAGAGVYLLDSADAAQGPADFEGASVQDRTGGHAHIRGAGRRFGPVRGEVRSRDVAHATGGGILRV